MNLKFNIQKTIESELFYGSYVIYILGGHHVEVNPNFYIQVVNNETKEEIELKEKYLKARDFKFRKKAVRFYTFQINEYAKFKISVHNYNDIVVKDSILEVYPFPFNIPNIVLSKVLGRSRQNKSLNDIEILIQ
ncbi:MAG: hypothetical protein O9267_08420 [Flavobacterium sp.]|uniref:hypothetical protein n=1 Tax=Flavobacterium sp. TaxID=239 RepID=UPI0022CC1699|nr:hypothetical protein [Flavobacterium sp.]MCZ8197617.1 hypothetical protein [Flavobacterium sp.]